MAYKVVEMSTVTDEEIERVLNEWTAKGYTFESIQFVTSVSSRNILGTLMLTLHLA